MISTRGQETKGNKSNRNPIREETGEERSKIKKSIDEVINREGRRLINKIKEKGWAILNGSLKELGSGYKLHYRKRQTIKRDKGGRRKK